MNGKERAREHNEDAQRYLEKTAWRYPFNPQSGIHEPTSARPDQPAQSEPSAQIDSPRPKANRAEIFSAFISFLGFFISFATLIGLFLTVAFSLKQWNESKRTADASIIAAEASQDAVAIADRSLKSSIENFQRDERPWIVVKLMEFAVTKQDKGYTLSGDVVIQNSGKSPAWNMHVSHAGTQTNYGMLDVDKWTATHPSDPMLKIVTDSAIISAGDQATIPFTEYPVSDKFGEDIKSHKLWVYTFGDISYTDSYGINHLTRYCGIWNPKTTRYDFCPNHQYVDREK